MRFYKIFLLFSFLLLISCNGHTPVSFLTEDYIYNQRDKNGDQARRILNHLYSTLPHGFNRIDNVVLGAATDDAIASDMYSRIEILSKARLSPFVKIPMDGGIKDIKR